MCKNHTIESTGHPENLPLDMCLDDITRVLCVTKNEEQAIRSIIPIDIFQGMSLDYSDQWFLHAWDVDLRYYILFLLPAMQEHSRSEMPFAKAQPAIQEGPQ